MPAEILQYSIIEQMGVFGLKYLRGFYCFSFLCSFCLVSATPTFLKNKTFEGWLLGRIQDPTFHSYNHKNSVSKKLEELHKKINARYTSDVWEKKLTRSKRDERYGDKNKFQNRDEFLKRHVFYRITLDFSVTKWPKVAQHWKAHDLSEDKTYYGPLRATFDSINNQYVVELYQLYWQYNRALFDKISVSELAAILVIPAEDVENGHINIGPGIWKKNQGKKYNPLKGGFNIFSDYLEEYSDKNIKVLAVDLKIKK